MSPLRARHRLDCKPRDRWQSKKKKLRIVRVRRGLPSVRPSVGPCRPKVYPRTRKKGALFHFCTNRVLRYTVLCVGMIRAAASFGRPCLVVYLVERPSLVPSPLQDTCFIGEVGLWGELKPVQSLASRIQARMYT